MRKPWKILLATLGGLFVLVGLAGWWYLDRTVLARRCEHQGIQALLGGDATTAEERFSAAIRKFPDSASPQKARVYHWRGRARSELKLPEQAIEDFSQAIVLEPTWHTPFAFRGKELYKQGRYPQAKEDLLKAVASDKNVAPIHYRLGLIAERSGSLDEARDHYQDAIQKEATYLPALTSLSRLFAKKGDKFGEAMYRNAATAIDANASFELE